MKKKKYVNSGTVSSPPRSLPPTPPQSQWVLALRGLTQGIGYQRAISLGGLCGRKSGCACGKSPGPGLCERPILASVWRGAQAAGWEVTQPRLHSQESGVSERLFSSTCVGRRPCPCLTVTVRVRAGPRLVGVAQSDSPTFIQPICTGHSAVLWGQVTQPGSGRPRSPCL